MQDGVVGCLCDGRADVVERFAGEVDRFREGRVELDQLVALVLAAEAVEVGGAAVTIPARGAGGRVEC